MKEKIEVVLAWFQLIIVVLTFIGVYATYGAFAEDRRDVNKDGEVNLTDLSVLAVEISEANKAE